MHDESQKAALITRRNNELARRAIREKEMDAKAAFSLIALREKSLPVPIKKHRFKRLFEAVQILSEQIQLRTVLLKDWILTGFSKDKFGRFFRYWCSLVFQRYR